MQPKQQDAYKRKRAFDPRVAKASLKPGVYEEQKDQWTVLKHEVTDESMPPQAAEPLWDQRDTDGNSFTSQAAFSFDTPSLTAHHVDIVVVGVGGGGMNAINRMIDAHVRGVRFIAMNTDAQVLALTKAPARICLGQHHTKGLGAGGNAAVGMRAATESAAEIRAALGEADLVFIAAGMGGGTGTGAAPVVAAIAKKIGALTVGIVTLPFSFEGTRRRRIAQQGLTDLSSEIDALITVPNDRLLSTFARDQNLSESFKIADDVLRQGVQGIAEVINVPGMVNVDFADVCSVLREAGTALMSIGQGEGRNRAQLAAESAIAGGFLNVTIRGAKRVLFNISGGEDMTLFEVNEVAERIGSAIDEAADIIFGAVIDPSLKDTIRVTLIAAGMEELHTSRIEAVRPDQLQSPMRPTQGYGTGTAAQSPRPLMPHKIPPPGQRLPPPIAPPPTQIPPSLPISSADPSPPGRQKRGLNDLRSIRGMGHRQEPGRDRSGDDKDIEPPPFLIRRD